MSAKIISDYLSALHHEANALEPVNVGERVAADGDEIGVFSRLDCTDTVRPTQHLGGVCGDGANHIEGGHSGLAQVKKRRNACLPARLAWIKPAHIRSSRKFHA